MFGSSKEKFADKVNSKTKEQELKEAEKAKKAGASLKSNAGGKKEGGLISKKVDLSGPTKKSKF